MFALFITFIVFLVILFGGLALADKLGLEDGPKFVFAVAVVGSLFLYFKYGESDAVDEVQHWLDQQQVYRLRPVDEILDSLPEKEEKWGIVR